MKSGFVTHRYTALHGNIVINQRCDGVTLKRASTGCRCAGARARVCRERRNTVTPLHFSQEIDIYINNQWLTSVTQNVTERNGIVASVTALKSQLNIGFLFGKAHSGPEIAALGRGSVR